MEKKPAVMSRKESQNCQQRRIVRVMKQLAITFFADEEYADFFLAFHQVANS
jgi:hypothetical protein